MKSAYELERIRVACEQVSHIGEWMTRHVREGMTELELAAEIERELRLAGHQGIIRFRSFNNELFYGAVLAGPSGAVPGASETPIVGPGPNLAVSKGASQRPIQRGEPILVDLAGAHDGYLSDQTRMFSIGSVEPRYAETHDLAREILHGVAAAAKPGVTGAALYDLGDRAGRRARGFMGAGDERVTFVGHGIGLEIDELPLLARGWDEPFEAGWSSRSTEVRVPRRGRRRDRELLPRDRERRRGADDRARGVGRALAGVEELRIAARGLEIAVSQRRWRSPSRFPRSGR